MLRRQDERSEESFDAMGLLQTLCLVKLDTVDGNKGKTEVRKVDEVKTNAADAAAGGGTAKNSLGCTNSATGKDTEMKGENISGFPDIKMFYNCLLFSPDLI